MSNLPQFDELTDFSRQIHTYNGRTKPVYVGGDGPAVIVMHEMPGISPHVARFARWIRDAGFSVYMPSLFGRDGAEVGADEGAEVFRLACISAEFRALGGGGQSSPVTLWLACLAQTAWQERAGPGVGAIGMCFSGNFALSLMLDPAVRAPVLCQPALPLDNPAGLEISAKQLKIIKDRLIDEDLEVHAYRFAGDAFCRAERFAAYSSALGDRFKGKVLHDDAAADRNLPPFVKAHIPTPHSVVTTHLIDRQGEPTIEARDEIIAFLHDKLDAG